MKRINLLLLAFIIATSIWGRDRMVVSDRSIRDTLAKDSSHLLKEVVIRTSPVKRKVDRFVLSIPPAQNKDGVELLQQAPGVWFSDERISINGSSGTKVFVDNREIKLTGELLIGYLHSLKSEDISRVEVIPLAGADRDADAQGGVIHIFTRRRADRGIQGNLSLTTSFASSLQSYQPSGSLNLHSGKWNAYGFASGTLTPENQGELLATRQYIVDGKEFSSLTTMKHPSRYGTLRMGTIYTINSSNSVGAELEYIRHASHWPSESLSRLSVGSAAMESRGVYRQEEEYDMYSATANYTRKLDTKGSSLKLVADHISKDSQGDNQYRITRNVKTYSSDTIYRSCSEATYQIATADFSWKQLLHDRSFLQAGMKYTYTGMNNESHYEGQQPDESWQSNAAYDYELNYHENIGAIYGTYSHNMKKGAVHVGFRGEYTQTSDRTDHQTRRYWDWFPHIDGSYCFDDLRKWMLIGQYGRYIERPAFTALNPNRVQTSDYSYLIGNPSLRPTYINKFSVTLVYNFRYTLTLGGNLHRDLIREFGKEDVVNPDISYVTFENHNRENHWFVALSTPWQPFTWLNVNANVIGVKQDIRMYRGGEDVSHFLYFGNANATFHLPSDYSLEGRYSGASRLFSGNSGIDPFHKFDIYLRKKWRDGRCVATLGVDNVFNHLNSYFTTVSGYTSVSRHELASSGRLLKLTFTWNFNRGGKAKSVTVEKQSSEERNRLEGK